MNGEALNFEVEKQVWNYRKAMDRFHVNGPEGFHNTTPAGVIVAELRAFFN